MNHRSLTVRKASGDVEPFSENKLRSSLQRAGASAAMTERVVRELHNILENEVHTHKLYSAAHAVLNADDGAAAASYSLKHAITELGPTGFPFERFVAAVLDAHGWETDVSVTLEGTVNHEIDVVATKGDRRALVECKYRGKGRKCNVKVALYIAARARDLLGELGDPNNEFWLVTNTRFTADAIRYGESVGLRLIAWDHPAKNNVRQLISTSGLHPLTCLTSLTKDQKRALLDKGIVLCRDLVEQDTALQDAGVVGASAELALREVQALLGSWVT